MIKHDIIHLFFSFSDLDNPQPGTSKTDLEKVKKGDELPAKKDSCSWAVSLTLSPSRTTLDLPKA